MTFPCGQRLLQQQPWTAPRCSTKSRAREIPRTFADGRPVRNCYAPRHTRKPWTRCQKRRVDVDNAAYAWILGQLHAIADDGQPCGRTRRGAMLCYTQGYWVAAEGKMASSRPGRHASGPQTTPRCRDGISGRSTGRGRSVGRPMSRNGVTASTPRRDSSRLPVVSRRPDLVQRLAIVTRCLTSFSLSVSLIR